MTCVTNRTDTEIYIRNGNYVCSISNINVINSYLELTICSIFTDNIRVHVTKWSVTSRPLSAKKKSTFSRYVLQRANKKTLPIRSVKNATKCSSLRFEDQMPLTEHILQIYKGIPICPDTGLWTGVWHLSHHSTTDTFPREGWCYHSAN